MAASRPASSATRSKAAVSTGGRVFVPWASVLTKWTSPCSTSDSASSLDLRPEIARQTSRRHLQQATAIDQRPHEAGLVEDAQIAFRMRENSHQPGRCQLGQQPIQRNINVMRQFEEHVPAVVGQRKNLAAANFLHQIWLDSHIGAGEHHQRHLMLGRGTAEAGRSPCESSGPSSSRRLPN